MNRFPSFTSSLNVKNQDTLLTTSFGDAKFFWFASKMEWVACGSGLFYVKLEQFSMRRNKFVRDGMKQFAMETHFNGRPKRKLNKFVRDGMKQFAMETHFNG